MFPSESLRNLTAAGLLMLPLVVPVLHHYHPADHGRHELPAAGWTAPPPRARFFTSDAGGPLFHFREPDDRHEDRDTARAVSPYHQATASGVPPGGGY